MHKMQRRFLFCYRRGYFEFHLSELFGRDLFGYRRSTRVYKLYGRDLFCYSRGYFEFHLYELFGRDLFCYSRGFLEFNLYELFGWHLFVDNWSNCSNCVHKTALGQPTAERRLLTPVT